MIKKIYMLPAMAAMLAMLPFTTAQDDVVKVGEDPQSKYYWRASDITGIRVYDQRGNPLAIVRDVGLNMATNEVGFIYAEIGQFELPDEIVDLPPFFSVPNRMLRVPTDLVQFDVRNGRPVASVKASDVRRIIDKLKGDDG